MVTTKELLLYWWRWYFHITPYEKHNKEYKSFQKIIRDYGEDKVLEIAVTSHLLYDGSPRIFLIAIRKNEIESLMKCLPIFSRFPEENKKKYEKVKEEFLENIRVKYRVDGN